MTVRLSGAIVATAALALAVPGVASADVSSLDAYAGQAAVLGKPHHKHHHHGGSSAGHRGSHGAVALAGRPPGSAATGSRTGGGSASGSTIGSGATAGGASGRAGAAASSDGASAGGNASAKGSSSAPSGESGLARGVRNAIPASSSSSLTGLDVAVLCAVALMLLGTGLLIRRLSRQPR